MTTVRFIISILSFSLSCSWYLLWHAKNEDIIYSNESLPLLFASLSFSKTFYEMHDFPEKNFYLFGFFLRRMRGILIHNNWKADYAKNIFGLAENKIFREPNAVQIEEFDIQATKKEARDKLELPPNKKIALYTGHLYSWKGADTLALAARELSSDYLIIFVGGTPEDVNRLKHIYGNNPNILITGWKPHRDIPLWQKAADILVLPNTGKVNISKFYTSPMKLFEYAASKRPIVASHIPSITELVDDRAVFFVPPDDPSELARAIERVCGDDRLSQSKSLYAYSWVREHTWQKRAGRIVSFIGLR